MDVGASVLTISFYNENVSLYNRMENYNEQGGAVVNQIFLVSSLVAVLDKIERELGQSLAGKSLVFIPTAGKVEEVKSYIEDAFNAFKAKEMTVTVLDVKTSPVSECRETIKTSDMIYVSGGNTFYLLEALREKGIDKLLIEEINAGKVYIGESAGGIILSPSIDYIGKMDDKEKAPSLSDMQGLNIVDFSPLPHVGHPYLGQFAQDIIENYQGETELVPFSDDQLLVVTESGYAIK